MGRLFAADHRRLTSFSEPSDGFHCKSSMLGSEVNMPAHLIFPLAGEKSQNPGHYVGKLTANLQKSHEVARSSLK